MGSRWTATGFLAGEGLPGEGLIRLDHPWEKGNTDEKHILGQSRSARPGSFG